MVQHLTLDEMKSLGVAVDGRIMDNGEKRFSLKVDGKGYIWTEPPADELPKWQNAHSHGGLYETFIVERGRVALAYIGSTPGTLGMYLVQIFEQGEVFTVPPHEDHNVYLFAGSAIHTVQHGRAVPNPAKPSGADWYESIRQFDEWSKALSEADMIRLDSESGYRHS